MFIFTFVKQTLTGNGSQRDLSLAQGKLLLINNQTNFHKCLTRNLLTEKESQRNPLLAVGKLLLKPMPISSPVSARVSRQDAFLENGLHTVGLRIICTLIASIARADRDRDQ